MIERYFIVALSIIILIGVGGCMDKKETKKYSNAEKKEMVLTYLRDKYGEEFEGVSYEPASLMQGHDQFYLYPKNGTREEMFPVSGSYNKDGTYEIGDGYLGVKIRPEYEKVMRTFIDEFYKEYKIYTRIRNSDLKMRWYNTKIIDGFDPKQEITNADMVTHIYVKESTAKGVNLEDTVEKIALKMVENKIVGKININVIKDNKFDLIKLDIENYKSATSSENLVKSYTLRINEDLQIKDYREGK